MRKLGLAGIFAIVLLLSASSVQAADLPTESRSALKSLHTRVVASIWNLLTAVWGANGCSLDPNGRCLGDEPTTSPDNGCGMDPDGRCLSSNAVPSNDNGCRADLNGLCRS